MSGWLRGLNARSGGRAPGCQVPEPPELRALLRPAPAAPATPERPAPRRSLTERRGAGAMGNAESVPAGSASRLSVSQSPGIRFGECNRSGERGSPPECPVLALRPPQLPLQASRAAVWCWAPGDRGVRALASEWGPWVLQCSVWVWRTRASHPLWVPGCRCFCPASFISEMEQIPVAFERGNLGIYFK